MSATILFDGVCNFCNSSVNYVIAHDPRGYFKFAALQSDAGERLTREHGIDSANVDSVVLIENGRAYVRSAAALRVAKKLGFPAALLYAFIVIPRPIRDILYDAFAKRRYRFFGSQDECMLPTPEIRARFL